MAKNESLCLTIPGALGGGGSRYGGFKRSSFGEGIRAAFCRGKAIEGVNLFKFIFGFLIFNVNKKLLVKRDLNYSLAAELLWAAGTSTMYTAIVPGLMFCERW